MYSFYYSYFGKKLSGIENPQAESFNTRKIPLIVSDNCITPRCYGDFQHIPFFEIQVKLDFCRTMITE
jgi:hypothetical protein